MSFNFPSLANPAVGYRYESSGCLWDAWWRTHDALGPSYGKYDTFNDNGIQHSPATCARIHDAVDYLNSLAVWLHEHPDDDFSFFPEVNDKTIEFAASLRFKPGKTQYYNMSTLKVSTAEKLRWDKRWKELHDDVNGQMPGILRIMSCENTDHPQHMTRLFIACKAAELCSVWWDIEDLWKDCGAYLWVGVENQGNLKEELRDTVKFVLSVLQEREARWMNRRKVKYMKEKYAKKEEEAAA